jgi:phenylpropionate dioxygenase-like ring-hydroxylating dioxygenase large terminal subunit
MKSLLGTLVVVSWFTIGLDAFAPPRFFTATRSKGVCLVESSSVAEAQDDSVAEAPASEPYYAGAPSPFANFDYYAHWYPVSWARDLRLNQPQKVTIFDVDYVVAKTSDTEVISMVDECPHKNAALSEGRVTSSGHFQCAYHGWSFNGTTGSCVEIPQVVQPDGTMPSKVPSRSCGTAVPAQIHQEMVWLFPGGGLEKALLATPPPSVEEYDTLNWKISKSVRDMPVDWPILISNICDVDHGLFAHQAKGFDLYTASKDYPINVQEDFPNDGKGWMLTTQVESTEKLLKVNEDLRPSKKKKKSLKGPQKVTAWAALQAPGLRQMKRLDANKETSFIGLFYVCPVGVGRSRFFGGAYSKKAPKHWLTNLFVQNFLDQDTYLLATQQKNILQKEAKEIRSLMETKSADELKHTEMSTRRKLFCYASPSEKAGMKIEQFWDATLLRAPNRIQRLLQLDAAGAFSKTPPRSVVLDRQRQYLDISPDAQDVVRNCERIVKSTKLFLALVVLAKVVTGSWAKAQAFDKFLKPSVLTGLIGISSLASWLAKKLKREYYFKYTEEIRRKDMGKIPTVWSDK